MNLDSIDSLNETKNKILIIDNSRVFLSYISQVLSPIQFIDFHLLNDPTSALDKALHYSPDIILTGLEMPHMSGIEILRIFKTHDKFKTTPIVMLSSNDTEKNLLIAIENGAHDFLNKTLSPKLILTKIVHLLKHKKVLDQDSKMKQLALLNQFISLANHEFNNALHISDMSLRRLKNQMTHLHDDRYLVKIEEMNQRMVVLVKKLENLKNIDVENFEKELSFFEIGY